MSDARKILRTLAHNLVRLSFFPFSLFLAVVVDRYITYAVPAVRLLLIFLPPLDIFRFY